jgi:hypothetical protein
VSMTRLVLIFEVEVEDGVCVMLRTFSKHLTDGGVESVDQDTLYGDRAADRDELNGYEVEALRTLNNNV